MPRFLTTKSALAAIEEIISHADRRLTLLCPYQRISSQYFDRLSAAAKRGVTITFVYGKEEMDRAQLERLRTLPKAELFFSERLHAKCYFNERGMIITSLNLLESSEQNWEMGVYVDARDGIFAAASREAELIITSARSIVVTARQTAPAASGWATFGGASDVTGFCIRCRDEIPLNSDRPFCALCFASWSEWQNWQYVERCCHECGAPFMTSRSRPLCSLCTLA